MRCPHCESEWTTRVKVTFHECPFCGRPLGVEGPKVAAVPKTESVPRVANRRSDFDIVGTVLRAYKGTDPVVVVPEGITELGHVVPGVPTFQNNKAVRKVILPSTIRKISNAFCNSTVEEVVFNVEMDEIGGFQECSALRSVTFKKDIGKIRDNAFCKCTSLKEVRFEGDVGDIGKKSFFGCTSLHRISFLHGSGNIGHEAFRNCTSLRTVEWVQAPEKIGASAFQRCRSLEKIWLMEGVKEIGEYAFADCSSLREVVLPFGISTISPGLFLNCYYLRKVVIPESVNKNTVMNFEMRGKEAPFEGCTALEDVRYPRLLGTDVFKGSAYLQILEDKKQRESERMRKINAGICPNCGGRLAMFSGRCKSCGCKF